jgi:hypothetical protein
MGFFGSASDATLQVGFCQEAYWMLMSDTPMRDRALSLVWHSLPKDVQRCLRETIWGLAERERDAAKVLVLMVVYQGPAVIVQALQYRRLECLRETLLHLTNVRDVHVYGTDNAIGMVLQKGRWVETTLTMPVDWHDRRTL